MSGCEQELCEHWTGEGCACAVFGIERSEVIVHVHHPIRDATARRDVALADLEQALTLALQAMADNDCCADPDDLDWRGPAIEQFRADLRALGVTDAELDTAGIRL
jgi:hypothetical protein